VLSGALPLGGVFGATRTIGAGVVDVASGTALLPPIPRIFWMKFCGFSFIWLQVLTGAVPSRNAAYITLSGQVESARRLEVLSMRAVVTPSGGMKDLTSEY